MESEQSKRWSFSNPVNIQFGAGVFDSLPEQIGGRRYAVVTYPGEPFTGLVARLSEQVGAAQLVVDDVVPNPDFSVLTEQCNRFAQLANGVEIIVAIGGGSVIDSAKVFAAANGDFDLVRRFLIGEAQSQDLSPVPIIAVPTTAGTGSEVTCWATVWDKQSARKYSLSLPKLYPEFAVIDPVLMINKPRDLTIATGLDSLSHALESIWNLNANPVSANYAVASARLVLDHLPALVDDPKNLVLRERIAQSALFAGLAFSNTKTALAHNLSYPITLGWDVPHGIACSFTLPAVLETVIGCGGFREESLKQIFGADLTAGAADLTKFIKDLGVGVRFADHGVPEADCLEIVDQAFAGERGKNYIGSKPVFMRVAAEHGLFGAS